jgi:hypothetical protein
MLQDFIHKRCRNSSRISLFLLLVVTFTISSKHLYAMEDDEQNLSENNLYHKGLLHRDNDEWQQAIECFTPLAEDRKVKAQHNLAWCYMKLGDDYNAYVWYQQAGQQNFEPSIRNLRLMNLIYLLLPDEILTLVASNFSRQDISSFNCVSRRANRVVRATVTRTNFLTSPSPFACEFFTFFKDMIFDPQPKALRLGQQAEAKEGSVTVHFRNTKHLIDIVEETPLIKAKHHVYFKFDPLVEYGEELEADVGKISTQYFIYFTSDVPLKITGKLHLSLPYTIVFPRQSNHSGLDLKKPGAITTGKLRAYDDGNTLAEAIDKFDSRLFDIRTQDAYQLLEKRKQSRLTTPQLFPTLQELCPDACLIATPDLQVIQDDYISADNSLIYVAESIQAMVDLKSKLPESSRCISYINPQISNSGIYCEYPLVLMKRFLIMSPNDLTMTGRITLPDHGIKIFSQGNIWLLYYNLLVGGDIQIRSEGSVTLDGHHPILLQNEKPAEMANEDWQKLLSHWHDRNLIP